ncbi:Xaa-Pro aminopeptidase [Acetivibrio straminisolvens JCM 21531]|uniref:Xaa-Pro aminopeptidase n=1 Tax=Acetivibrio straminisolvens JCM 21531 TaxID=1294263 RepID=W4VBY9_9FIRM|nr:Xaa-Pro aminopeptidase [Acetivibrio straminisolvens JCM 21531]
MYYFTGTMQEGMLLIPRDDEAVLWVRRSYERAEDESLFPLIRPMGSYRDAVGSYKNLPDTIYLETYFVPLAMFQRFQKYFPFKNVKPLDMIIAKLRSLKSNYELEKIKRAGEVHRRVLEERVPEILEEGMSEAELATRLFSVMVEEGHQAYPAFQCLIPKWP